MSVKKVSVRGTLVELDGDEMTRIMWQLVKDKLLMPYLDMKLEYFDLGLENRDKTNDSVTLQAAEAIETVESGVMTGDLLRVALPSTTNKAVYTEEFFAEVADRLNRKIVQD